MEYIVKVSNKDYSISLVCSILLVTSSKIVDAIWPVFIFDQAYIE